MANSQLPLARVVQPRHTADLFVLTRANRSEQRDLTPHVKAHQLTQLTGAQRAAMP
jgi:hypothetical protein